RFEMQDSDRPAVARQKLEQGVVAILDGARHPGSSEPVSSGADVSPASWACVPPAPLASHPTIVPGRDSRAESRDNSSAPEPAPFAVREHVEDGPGTSQAADDAQQAAHFIGHLVGLDFSSSPYLRGILNDAKQIRDRAFQYL